MWCQLSMREELRLVATIQRRIFFYGFWVSFCIDVDWEVTDQAVEFVVPS